MPAGIYRRPKTPKGVVGYRPRRPSFQSQRNPLRHQGKDHSARPASSTKRPGCKRGPGDAGSRAKGRRWAGGA